MRSILIIPPRCEMGRGSHFDQHTSDFSTFEVRFSVHNMCCQSKRSMHPCTEYPCTQHHGAHTILWQNRYWLGWNYFVLDFQDSLTFFDSEILRCPSYYHVYFFFIFMGLEGPQNFSVVNLMKLTEWSATSRAPTIAFRKLPPWLELCFYTISWLPELYRACPD